MHDLRELSDLRPAPRNTPPAVLSAMFIAAAAGIVILVAGNPGGASASAPLPGISASPLAPEHGRSATADAAGRPRVVAKSS